VHLDEGAEVEGGGEARGNGEEVVVEHRSDEQHGVGAHEPGVGHVAHVDGEVLAEDGQPAGGPCLAEVRRRTPEEPLIGQHREAGGAAALVRPGERGGVEVEGEGALRG
jgi:hypothetical protein